MMNDYLVKELSKIVSYLKRYRDEKSFFKAKQMLTDLYLEVEGIDNFKYSVSSAKKAAYKESVSDIIESQQFTVPKKHYVGARTTPDWNTKELDTLVEYYTPHLLNDDKVLEELSEKLKRSISAIKTKVRRLHQLGAFCE